MIEKYLSLCGQTQTLKVIEKSKFITTSTRVENEEQARAFIAEISEKFSDATHNCYAYIPDITANSPRFSDNGEPQGTAGIPMLEVLKNKKIVQAAVVVTRYFGGVKLGAGGLVRAYSGCVAENLEAAQKALYETCAEMEISVDYPLADALLRFLSDMRVNVLKTEYSSVARYVVAIKKTEETAFCAALVNRMNGSVKFQKLKEYFYPFKI